MANRRRYTFELAERDPQVVIEEIKGINPFTREPMTIRTSKSVWSPEKREAVNALLAERDGKCNDDGYNFVKFKDGTELQICFGYGGQSGEGSEVNILCKQLNEEAAGFVFDLIRTADMALVREMDEEQRVAVLGVPVDVKVKQRWPQAVALSNSRALIDWLEQGGFHETD